MVSRQRIRRALRTAFEDFELDPAWGEALGETESGLQPAVNMTGGDLARGGSFGPTQISQKTARAFGYKGAMETLNTDPELAADLTAAMVADGFAERGGAIYHYGRPLSFDQMLAVWNAGRLDSDPALPIITRRDYIPRANRILADQEEEA